jgi:hypothetical protein
MKMYKIQWSHHTEEEATWETEHFLNTKYLGFFNRETVRTLPLPLSLIFESRVEIPFKGGRP